MKYRLKPVEVEAMEMTAPVKEVVIAPGSETCQVGDFLVRDPDGSLRLMSRDAFLAAYDPCDPGAVFTDQATNSTVLKKVFLRAI